MQIRQLIATTAVFEIAYEESGPASGFPIVLLHGFPYDVRQYDAVRNALMDSGRRILVPYFRDFGPTQYRDQRTFCSGQQAALGKDVIDFLDALRITAAREQASNPFRPECSSNTGCAAAPFITRKNGLRLLRTAHRAQGRPLRSR